MSGRRSKKSKFYSRSYSKPLFDPQRLLYFSTQNQRIGKVIRPKSTAVSNVKVITKDDEKQILQDLNETKTFRLQRKGKQGFPICNFQASDEFETIAIQGHYNDTSFNYIFSFPFTNILNPIPRTESFVKNFSPYTPSLCSPYRILNALDIDITNKVVGDIIHYYLYLLTAEEMATFIDNPASASVVAVAPYSFYHFQLPLDEVNKTHVELQTDSCKFTLFQTMNQGDTINNYIFSGPKLGYTYESGNKLVFPPGTITFNERQLTPELILRFVYYTNQIIESYEIRRCPAPVTDHNHFQIPEELLNVYPNQIISQNPDNHLYLCCSIFVTRTNPENHAKLPCLYTYEFDGIEINPYINGQ